jgi:hypothetical protein
MPLLTAASLRQTIAQADEHADPTALVPSMITLDDHLSLFISVGDETREYRAHSACLHHRG